MKAEYKNYVLLKDIDWFGQPIFAGTIYRQINNDYWQPIINQAQCPNLQVSFMTVRSNRNYFLEIKN